MRTIRCDSNRLRLFGPKHPTQPDSPSNNAGRVVAFESEPFGSRSVLQVVTSECVMCNCLFFTATPEYAPEMQMKRHALAELRCARLRVVTPTNFANARQRFTAQNVKMI